MRCECFSYEENTNICTKCIFIKINTCSLNNRIDTKRRQLYKKTTRTIHDIQPGSQLRVSFDVFVLHNLFDVRSGYLVVETGI